MKRAGNHTFGEMQFSQRALRPVFHGQLAASTLVLALTGALTISVARDATAAGPVPVPCAGSGACGVNPAANLPFVHSGAATYAATATSATITQTSNTAILNWASFNVGAGNLVQFIQPGAASRALNRIWQADPSVIAGAIKANGQIYLINQNGIIFANGAQVNANTLVASTLDISNELFSNGILSNLTPATTPVFTLFANGQPSGAIQVSAGADLRSEREGRIMLLAPQVMNNGAISTPDGQTVLAAGQKVYLAASANANLRGLLVEVDSGGTATNLGTLMAERGNITMVGLAVNQSGRATATTSVNLNGSIRLLARDTATEVASTTGGSSIPVGSRTGAVVLGAGSVTEVRPDTSTQTSVDEPVLNTTTGKVEAKSSFVPSSVEVLGKSINMQENSSIVAPGGQVTLTAQAGLEFQSSTAPAVDGARIYLTPGSSIDVSGSQNVAVPIERNLVQVELRGDELKDTPLQRNGFLRGKTITVDARKTTPAPLANTDAYTIRVARTAAERTATGGTIALKAEGDVILRDGSALDVSGGGIRYQDGYLKTTKLVSDGKIYDIGSAPADRVYDGFADSYTKTYGRWGVTEVFKNQDRGQFTAGYYEGRSAGTININSHGAVLDGSLRGKAVAGPNQRDIATVPLGGQLVIGDTKPTSVIPDYRIAGFDFSNTRSLLPGSFDISSPLQTGTVTVPIDVVTESGFSRLQLSTNGTVNVPFGVDLALAPGGSFTAVGRQIHIGGAITAPSGSIALATTSTDGPLGQPQDYGITLVPGARLDAKGLWTNDSRAVTNTPAGVIAIKGGSVSIASAFDVTLGAGSSIDVSGGGWLQAGNKLKGGDAGAISIESGTTVIGGISSPGDITLGGTLNGYAIGKGGTLSLKAQQVVIGEQAADPGAGIALTPDFFQSGGFKDYTVRGTIGLAVQGATTIAPLAQSVILNNGFDLQRSGANIATFSTHAALAPERRTAQSITLGSSSNLLGELRIGEGAVVHVDPGGAIKLDAGRQLTMLGTLEARGGAINLSLPDAGGAEPFDPGQSIWLGPNSQILTGGVAKVLTNDSGQRAGEVLRGGSVSIAAGRGYLIGQAGASIDVSGASAVLDVAQNVQGNSVRTPTTVASDGGSIALSSREGILYDGSLTGAPGAGAAARGGTVSFAIDYKDTLTGYPAGARVATFAQSGSTSAPTIVGAAVSNALNGKALIFADKVMTGGFDELAVKSRDRIDFTGSVNLGVRGAISLDAPVIAAQGGADATLGAAYVALGNRDVIRQALQVASSGSATPHTEKLTVNAKTIDLEGSLALQGIDNVTLNASEDIRGKGALNTVTGRSLDGALSAGGDINLNARQVYPTTYSNFRFESVGNVSGTIAVNRVGSDTPILSAGGKLTLTAPNIVQQGVLKAPFGEIVLNGAESLTLAANSITSVSGEGQLIPFGKTDLSGIDYIYSLGDGNSVVLQGPPEKTVRLNSKAVNIAAGSTINLAGGGDLYAYEFIAGPGGSKDVLLAANAPGSYAIVPGLVAPFAPYDHQSQLGVTGLKSGDRVYLSGGNGLPTGTYTLLPARYALLPGAFLVAQQNGTTDMLPSQNRRLVTGTEIVSGYRISASADGSLIRDTRTSGFEIKTGAQVRTASEYRETTASTYYSGSANVQLPGDAGRLSIAATQSLALAGNLATANASGRRGAEVDITAPKLAVISTGDAATGNGFVDLTADSLTNLNAASVLLGGTRSTTAEGVEVRVGAQEVVVSNRAASTLKAPELLIAANDKITVKTGARLEGKGAAGAAPRKMIVGFAIADSNGDGLINASDSNRSDTNGNGIIDAGDNISGNGALLRLSSGSKDALERRNFDRTAGQLTVESGAVLSADGAMRLDATNSNVLGSNLQLAAGGALALGAPRVSIGETDIPGQPGVSNVVNGLVLSNDRLQALGKPADLAIRSYSTVDLFGAAVLGDAAGGADRIKTLSIEAAGFGGYLNSGKTAVIAADNLTLSNLSNATFSNAPALAVGGVPAPGDGSLRITGQNVTLAAGVFNVNGFSNTTIAAQREVVAGKVGEFKTPGNLGVEASRITAAAGADYKITLTGSASVFSDARPAVPATDLATAGLGGKLAVKAATIQHNGVFEMPSGVLKLEAVGAAGPASAGSVTLAAGSRINAAGVAQAFFDKTVPTAGGAVQLSSTNADVVVAGDATGKAVVDVSGADGAAGGILTMNAVAGAAQVAGVLKGGANTLAGSSAPRQGEFNLDVGTLADFNALNAQLKPVLDPVTGRLVSGGFTASRDLRVRSGSIDIGSAAAPGGESAANSNGTTVTAQRFQLATDNGSINLYGVIDASGDKGGAVLLASGGATGSVNVIGNANDAQRAKIFANGTEAVPSKFGTHGEGGTVTLSTVSGSVNVQANTQINVAGAGAARGGQVLMRAQRNGAGNDVPITALGEIAGARDVIAEGYKVYTATNITATGANSATNFNASTTGTAFTEAQSFVNNTRANAGSINSASRLSAAAQANFHLRPGVEVQSPGDLTVIVNETATFLDQRGWNLGAWRFGSGTAVAGFSQEPGVLTLRATGNINMNSSIGDGFAVPVPSPNTAANSRLMNEWTFLTPDNAATPLLREDNSWSLRVVAGAQTSAANPLAVNAAVTGNLTVADNKLLRTGNGSIDVAAGGNLSLAGAGAVIYTAGVAGPAIANFTLPNLGILSPPATVRRPQFPQDGGDLNIRVGGGITAVASEQLITGWFQRQGAVDANGNITAEQVAWWPRFDGARLSSTTTAANYLQGGFRQGVGALGGGDVTVHAGGDINKLAVSTPTNGRLGGVAGSTPDASNLVVQGGGAIRVESGGNILSGIFFVDRGRADIIARGNIAAAPDRTVSTILAIGDGQMNLRAGGAINIDGVVNPTMLTQGPRNNQSVNSTSAPGSAPQTVFFTYSDKSALDLTAVGDIVLANRADKVRAAYATAPAGATQALFPTAAVAGEQSLTAYPGTLRAASLTGDIDVNGRFSMYPAAMGTLELLAGGSVNIPVTIAMSDVAATKLPSVVKPFGAFSQASSVLEAGLGASAHTDPPLHAGDIEPVRVYAVTGSITGDVASIPNLQSPKQTRIIAGKDVKDFSLRGQNVSDNDVTLIAAGQDVIFTTPRSALGVPQAANSGIELGGPGALEVIAGRNIDLSTSKGIVTRGNLNNPLLPEGGASVMTLSGAPVFAAGAKPRLDAANFLAPDGGNTADLPPVRLTKADLVAHVRKMTGDTTVDEANASARFNALTPQQQWPLFLNAFFNALKETGRAAVADNAGFDRGYQAIEKIFPAGNYKGDTSLFFSQLKTEQGGDIEMFAPGGTINVGLANVGGFSKSASALGIVTVRGGSVKAFVRDDFLVNSSRVFTLGGGDIVIWSSEGSIDAGKGAKTASATPPPQLKIDTDGKITLDTTNSVSGSGIGVLLSKADIAAGDVDLIAPRGSVNAGDAGIRSAGNLTIASPRVIGADNIQVGGNACGVPAADTGGLAAGAAGAASAASGATKTDQVVRNPSSGQGPSQQGGYRPTFISVEILGFGDT